MGPSIWLGALRRVIIPPPPHSVSLACFFLSALLGIPPSWLPSTFLMLLLLSTPRWTEYIKNKMVKSLCPLHRCHTQALGSKDPKEIVGNPHACWMGVCVASLQWALWPPGTQEQTKPLLPALLAGPWPLALASKGSSIQVGKHSGQKQVKRKERKDFGDIDRKDKFPKQIYS